MKTLISLCISFFCLLANAQLEDKTLFKIDDDSYKVGSFLKSFYKNTNLTSSPKETIENHLERYIDFQLKLKSAYELKLDTMPSFQKEFKKQYDQIADSYISNGDVTEAMLREAYERTKTEVRASHIILQLPEHENDTSEVYQKALMIKKRIDGGESFENLANKFSEDSSSKYGGDLNWFNTFTMVYEFEDAAYKLEVGEVSMPVRTKFGYHIIKKTDERPTKGKTKTAHIFLRDSDSVQNAEDLLNKIYKRLEQGEDFHELAKKYSQDKNSASSGGYISPFSLGGLNSKVYENETYELKNIGDYSKPFKSKFGWHIIKLVDVEPLEPYEEVKVRLKKRLKSSSRSKILVSKIKENLEKLYHVVIDEEAKEYFLNLMDESYNKGKWKYQPEKGVSNKIIIQVENRDLNYDTFGAYLEKKQLSLSDLPPNSVVLNDAINELVYRELIRYHKTKLSEIDEQFKESIDEYKNGILIFDYMNMKVWEPSAEDTLAQQKYYNKNKNDFRIPQTYEGQLYTSKSEESLKSFRSEMELLKRNDTTYREIPENIIKEEVSLYKSSSKLPKRFKFRKGISRVYKHLNQFMFMNINSIKASRILTFEEVKGRLISLLQEDYTKNLIKELRNKYKVEINDETLLLLKENLEN